VSDNGTQFANHQLDKLCSELGIKQIFASVEHPWTNGQVESDNRIDLAQRLKKKVRENQGSLGRGGSLNSLGLSHHASI